MEQRPSLGANSDSSSQKIYVTQGFLTMFMNERNNVSVGMS